MKASVLGQEGTEMKEAIHLDATYAYRLAALMPEVEKVLEDALKVADFELHGPRPWHFAARALLAKIKGA